MKLRTVHVREFKSVWDSNPFDVGKATCLVGKNESGKTAILQALYRLNPIIPADGNFDVTDDYPRAEVENYQQDVENGSRTHATVIEAVFALEEPELLAVEKDYGGQALERKEVTLSKGYERSANGKTCTRYVTVPVVESAVVQHLVNAYQLPDRIKKEAIKTQSLQDLATYLEEEAKRQADAASAATAASNKIADEAEKAQALDKAKQLAETEQAKALRARLKELLAAPNLGLHIWETIIKQHFPQFLYFNEYYQLTGHDNIDALKTRQEKGKLWPSDHPLLGLIELARLDLDELLSPERTQALKNKLQGASNHLSSQILKFWSQNKHLRMQFDVRPALPGDPEGMRTGTNIWGEVFDSKHLVSTGLGTRSAGFVWFFSFLAWYSAIKKKNQPLVLLLDEPGLSLHGKAQEDLLRYFEVEIVPNPNHQLIYTTHSPFMVDAQHFERVRIVQDKGIDTDEVLPREQDGTKVFTDVLEAGPDSLFPLQGALGYEIHQTLFIGPNSLIVEGASDLLYLQAISGILASKGREGLDARWTITPVGGADKVPTFVALVRSQKNLNVATLIDLQKSNAQMVANLYKEKLLKRNHVLTFADFTHTKEADIEDMFDEDFYIQVVNEEFADSLTKKIQRTDLTKGSPRVLVRLDGYFSKHPLKQGAKFTHYRPARYFAERGGTLAVPASTLDRFEAAFKAVNALLPS